MENSRHRFNGKSAVVTGAASGIGLAIAETLLSEGALVLINDIDAGALEKADHRLRERYQDRVRFLLGDGSKMDLIEALVDKVVEDFGSLDLVVANAGKTLFGSFFDFEADDFCELMDLNLQGTFFLTQAAARQMRKQTRGGKILLTTSVIGIQAYPELTAYAMTKAALSMMARNLVMELSPHHININCIAPGATLTARTTTESQNYAEDWARRIPLGKIAYPIDIASSALFLLSDDANHITGQTLVVDGGWTAYSPVPGSRL